MKLRELGAQLFNAGKPVETVAQADYMVMSCPGCLRSGVEHRLTVPLKPPGTHWTAEGNTIDDITFVPRKVGGTSVVANCTPEAQWHGWILDGEAVDWQPGD